MIDPLPTNERDAVGAADRLIVAIGARLAAAVPTLALVQAWPDALGRSVTEPAPGGRRGAVLGAGLFFVGVVVWSAALYAAGRVFGLPS